MTTFSYLVAEVLNSPIWSATGIFFVGMVVYYHKVVVRPVVLHARKGGKFDGFLRRHLDVLRHNYWPTFWCFEPRMQTVLASITRKLLIPDIVYKREVRQERCLSLSPSLVSSFSLYPSSPLSL
jgi:hypothetical protein